MANLVGMRKWKWICSISLGLHSLVIVKDSGKGITEYRMCRMMPIGSDQFDWTECASTLIINYQWEWILRSDSLWSH